MSIEENPYLQRLDQLEAARTKYEELRWRLAFLRTGSAEPDPEPTEEDIIKWHIRNQAESGLSGVRGKQDQPMTPNLWFEQRFPGQTAQFGPAFLELRQTGAGYTRTTPISTMKRMPKKKASPCSDSSPRRSKKKWYAR